jgi:hypothetical protein
MQYRINNLFIKIEINYINNIYSQCNRKVQGSQSHIIVANNTLQLIVYYEVPAENQKREEVKRKLKT